jgi:hypothetical protein
MGEHLQRLADGGPSAHASVFGGFRPFREFNRFEEAEA